MKYQSTGKARNHHICDIYLLEQKETIWCICINERACPGCYSALTLWRLGSCNFTNPRDGSLFGDFLFFLLTQSFVCHDSQFSSIFTILQEHMSLWPQCNILFLHHQVHDALNDIKMTPPWCYNRGTYMSFQSLNKGWTFMSFQSSKG